MELAGQTPNANGTVLLVPMIHAKPIQLLQTAMADPNVSGTSTNPAVPMINVLTMRLTHLVQPMPNVSGTQLQNAQLMPVHS